MPDQRWPQLHRGRKPEISATLRAVGIAKEGINEQHLRAKLTLFLVKRGVMKKLDRPEVQLITHMTSAPYRE